MLIYYIYILHILNIELQKKSFVKKNIDLYRIRHHYGQDRGKQTDNLPGVDIAILGFNGYMILPSLILMTLPHLEARPSL